MFRILDESDNLNKADWKSTISNRLQWNRVKLFNKKRYIFRSGNRCTPSWFIDSVSIVISNLRRNFFRNKFWTLTRQYYTWHSLKLPNSEKTAFNIWALAETKTLTKPCLFLTLCSPVITLVSIRDNRQAYHN